MKLETNKKPTDHRQGKLVDLVDFIQKLTEMQSDDHLWRGEEYNPEIVEKIINMLRQLRKFDITEIGDLYLTSGGRVVLDKGYGEYFMEDDKVIFTLEEITNGIKLSKFMERLGEVK